MGKAIKNIRNFFEPGVFFIPFTLYFLFFATGIFIGYEWLMSKEQIPNTSFTDIFNLLMKVGFWFVIIITGIALLSVAASYIIFLWKKNRNAIHFSVSSSATMQDVNGIQRQKIHIEISPLLKPFLGFIKLRLQYDGKNFSDKFLLNEESNRKIISTSFKGDFLWDLPEIKEYEVEKVIIYFEDLFQFFSFTIALHATNRFYTQPLDKPATEFQVSPRKTEESNTRIEELKKVEGEFLNYKNFENNDDVRRIVWKIYAKNKELVVRIPEVLDPYASHAYMYVSFFTDFDITANKTAEIYFLNFYKTISWAIFQKLVQQGFDVRYIPDQQTPSKNFTEEKQAIEYAISTSKWQTDKDLKNYVKSKDASVVVIHSFSNADDVQQLLEANGGSCFFVLIKLSNSLQRSYLISLVRWLFIQQEKNEMEVYKTSWRLSLLRPRVLQNEKKLEAMVSKYSKTLVI